MTAASCMDAGEATMRVGACPHTGAAAMPSSDAGMTPTANRSNMDSAGCSPVSYVQVTSDSAAPPLTFNSIFYQDSYLFSDSYTNISFCCQNLISYIL